MEMVVKSMETAVEAMESMEMAPGALPIPAGCRNRDFFPPKFVGSDGGAAELFFKKHRLI
jgi:hypothetical protein